MAKRRLWYLLAIVACMVFYVAYQGWFSSLALAALVFLPVLSLVLSLPAMLTTRWDLRCDWQQDRIYVHLDRRGKLPAPPFNLNIRAKRIITGEVWCPQSGEWVPGDHCGKVVFEPQKARLQDYMGLFSTKIRGLEPVSVLIRPTPRPIEDLTALERCLEGSWRPKPGGGYAEQHELRPYRPGDNLNQIHWKMTAKVGKPIIREAMEPDRGRVVLTMDLRGTPAELDEKFGHLLWLSNALTDQSVVHELLVWTGRGQKSYTLRMNADLDRAVEELLGLTPAAEDRAMALCPQASWHYHLGGGEDEA